MSLLKPICLTLLLLVCAGSLFSQTGRYYNEDMRKYPELSFEQINQSIDKSMMTYGERIQEIREKIDQTERRPVPASSITLPPSIAERLPKRTVPKRDPIIERYRTKALIDPITENLIGVLLATDLKKSTLVEAKALSIRSPLSALSADLKRRYLQINPRKVGEALLVDMAAVSRSSSEQGNLSRHAS